MEMRFLIIALIGLSFFSCKKAENRKCFKGSGEDAEQVIVTDKNIDTLYLYDDIYYTLEQGEETKVVLTGGENLLSHIQVEFNNGRLTVENQNKCKFLRSYKEQIRAKIYVDSITYIHYEGSKELMSKDTLRSNELRIIITDGAGSTDLTLVNGYTSATVTHGFGDFTLRGKTISAYLHCNTNSFCDTRSFDIQNFLIVYSNTVGNMKVNASTNHFAATINQSGNIEYTGTPLVETLIFKGSGKVISLNN